MHGRPVILAGSIVICSYATSLKVRQPAPARCVAAALCLAYTSAAMGVYCGSGDVCRDDVSGVAVQGGPGPLWRMVVRGSACEAASCTSLSGTPASSAAVMNACRHASRTAWCRKPVTSQVTTGSACTRPGRTQPDSSGLPDLPVPDPVRRRQTRSPRMACKALGVRTLLTRAIKEMVHDFGALGQGRPDLVPVNAFGDGCAAVAYQACDVFKVDVVSAEQADKGVPKLSRRPLLAKSRCLGDHAE